MMGSLRQLKQSSTRLSHQLLIRFGLALFTVGIGTLGINYRLVTEDLHQQAQHRSQSLSESLVFATEGLIEIKSSSTLQRVVQNYATLPAVLKICILTPDGKVMAYAGLNDAQFNPQGQIDSQIKALMEKSSLTGVPINERITLHNEPVLLNILPFSSTLFATPGRRGLAVVFFDLQEMEEEAWRTFSTSSLTLLSGIVLILVIMGLSIRRTVLKPLKKLNQAVAESSSSGEFRLPTDLPNQEISFLAETFGQVFVQLTETEEELAITEKMAQLSQALRESEERYRAIVKQTLDGIFLVDVDTKAIIEANEAYCRLLGYLGPELRQCSLYDVMGISQEEVDRNINKFLETGENFFSECSHRCRDGSLVSVDTSISLIEFSGKRVCCFAVRDLTERKEAQAKLEYQSLYDALTELPNSKYFNKILRQSLIVAKHNQHQLAILFLDLDRFKNINDTLGHALGDQLLQDFSGRLKSCIRHGDMIARWGGDEFIILLPCLEESQEALQIAQRILDALEKPFSIAKHRLHVATSIGIAIYPDDAQDAQTLVKRADVALHQAKETGRNNFQVYSPIMDAQASELLELENALHRALKRQEFVLYYQPQIDINTSSVCGMEALLRWQHPEYGLVSPAKFIPLAEETGLIVPIGEWVLQTACAQNKAWQDLGLSPLQVAVNLSPRQLQDQNLLATINQVLRETSLDPQWLELEITESSLMQDVDMAIQLLDKIKAMGVHLSMDDFGTGYSSLSYLKKFPFNTLKIDQSFVRELTSSCQDLAIISAMIGLARGLRLRVVAEGIETQEQLKLLRSLNCSVMQGYFFSKPLVTEEATRFLQKATYRVKVEV